MMLGAQFSSLGIVGFMIYRGCKKNEAFRQAQQATPRSPDSEC